MKHVAIGLVCLFGLILLIPLLMMVSGSFMGQEEAPAASSRVIPRHPTFENYVTLFEYPMLRWFGNSAFIAVGGVSLALMVATITAFGVAKFRFRGRELVLAAIVLNILTPALILTIPRFIIIRRLGLYDTYAAMIFPMVFAPASVWFMIKYMKVIPDDLINMGRLDGLGPFGLLWHVIVPMAKTGIAALGALGIVSSWQEYLWPLLVLKSPEKLVLPVGVREVMFMQWIKDMSRAGGLGLTANHSILLAGAVIATVPAVILFLFTQKYFIGGLFARSTGGE